MTSEKPSTRKRVIEALQKKDRAVRLEDWAEHKATEMGDRIGAKAVRSDAAKLREEADADLSHWAHTTRLPQRGNGGELVPLFESDPVDRSQRDYKREMVEEASDVLAHQASSDAMGLAVKADVLPAALDMANGIKARNRAERLLAHQAAAMHALGMKLVTRAQDEITRAEGAFAYQNAGQRRQLANVEAARLTNAAARAMSSFQEAMLTLQKLRTGGKQVVKVVHQQVQVNDGGKAVVAGSIKNRKPSPRGSGRGSGRRGSK
jgi:hypothetical protein